MAAPLLCGSAFAVWHCYVWHCVVWQPLAAVAAAESKIYTQPSLTAMLLWCGTAVRGAGMLLFETAVVPQGTVLALCGRGAEYHKHTIITAWQTALFINILLSPRGKLRCVEDGRPLRATKVVSPSHHTSALALYMSPRPHHRLFRSDST